MSERDVTVQQALRTSSISYLFIIGQVLAVSEVL